MHALVLHQPWATFLARGIKRIETRGRNTGVRGAVAIVAGKHWDRTLAALCCVDPFRTLLRDLGYDAPPEDRKGPHAAGWWSRGRNLYGFGLPFGAVVGVGNLTRTRFTGGRGEADPPGSCGGWPMPWVRDLSLVERALGDFTPGRWGWAFADARPLVTPVPVVGRQGFWTLDAATERRVRAALAASEGPARA